MIKRHSLKVDYLLLATVILLVVLGSVIVYSASYYELEIGLRIEADYYYFNVLIYALVGIILMLAISFFPYEYLKKLVPVILLVSVVFLVLVLVAGTSIKGGKRWLEYGGFTFMPSELAKVSIIFLTAWFVDRVGTKLRDYKVFALLFALGLIFVVLVYPQKDLATTLLLIALMMGMYLMAGARISHLLGISVIGVVFGIVAIMAESYRGSRMQIWKETLFDRAYLFTDAKRQIMNSIYAISSGGLTGRGLGMSEFSNLRLPDAYSDFIFAIYAEELGLVGSLLLLFLYAFLIYRVFKTALHCEDLFGFMLAGGTGLLIALHVIINVGVALAILPTTGLTLPFVSKGGTSLVILCMLLGVVLNISSKAHEGRATELNEKLQ